MIQCDRCGKHGDPSLYGYTYQPSIAPVNPIYISDIDDTGQICDDCYTAIGHDAATEFIRTKRK